MGHADWIAAGEARRDERERADTERTRELLPVAARLLRDAFGATRVVVFGSFGPSGRPRAHSDVDLLVTGIGEIDFLRATARLMALLQRPVDLVPAERAHPEVVAETSRTGRSLLGP